MFPGALRSSLVDRMFNTWNAPEKRLERRRFLVGVLGRSFFTWNRLGKRERGKETARKRERVNLKITLLCSTEWEIL